MKQVDGTMVLLWFDNNMGVEHVKWGVLYYHGLRSLPYQCTIQYVCSGNGMLLDWKRGHLLSDASVHGNAFDDSI